MDLKFAYLNLVLQLNAVVGNGGSLIANQVVNEAVGGDPLTWLMNRYPTDLDLSLVFAGRTACDNVNNWFMNCALVNDAKNYGLTNSTDGVALLIASCIDGVKTVLFP